MSPLLILPIITALYANVYANPQRITISNESPHTMRIFYYSPSHGFHGPHVLVKKSIRLFPQTRALIPIHHVRHRNNAILYRIDTTQGASINGRLHCTRVHGASRINFQDPPGSYRIICEGDPH